MSIELREGIREIAGGEWWNSSGENGFLIIALDLMRNGYTEEDALMLLESVYCIVSAEFGS